MSQTCTKCQRINPDEAVYCYWDGALLQGHSANGAPLNPGLVPFPAPFVFPSGQSCQNFDQLALACQNSWRDAIELLKKGFLGGFFGGLGRADLAVAAQEAAQFPDQDRGLDQLLAKLPSRALESPRLKVEPIEINLGTVPMGADRTFEIRLANQGMRLLFGSIASDSKWLTIGEPPGQNQKIFQFRDEMVIPIQIRGKELRAGIKPLEGHLFIDSNGGKQVQINIRLEVPVKLFPESVLAGAQTPRQVAEKAKASPKEAAALFETGVVARWFADNGWTYPVQGPSASGLGAVQQFFEALGLARAPKVIIDKQAIALQGAPNQPVHATLEVKTEEKRPVYAHASANVPWVDVSQTRLAGRVAFITVRIPSVPYRPGEILSARIRVAANGNQRFEVPLNLTVTGGPGTPTGRMPAYPAPPSVVPAAPLMAVAAEVLPDDGELVPAASVIPVAPLRPAPSAHVTATPPAYDAADPFGSFATGASTGGQLVSAAPPGGSSRLLLRPRGTRTPMLIHVLPLVLLLLALGGTVFKDLFLGSRAEGQTSIPIDTNPHIGVGFDWRPFVNDPKIPTGDTMRFGVWQVLNPGQPTPITKSLTFDTLGISNSTVLRIDGRELNYADRTEGHWDGGQPKLFGKYGGARAAWKHQASKIKVTQTVEKIPGDPFVDGGQLKRAVDTCLVRYTIENTDNQPHSVGLRVLWDTLIGDNDGVPFTVAGQTYLEDVARDFATPEQVPDFVQALEKPDLKNPGVVVRLKLRNPDIQGPDRVLLTAWPRGEVKGKRQIYFWDVPLKSFKEAHDSCVVMYWNEKVLKPGESHTVGFGYGLVHLVEGTGGLGATVSGDFAPGKKITITGYVAAPKEGETLTLKLPDGLRLDGSPETQGVPPAQGALAANPNPVTWNITASATGNYVVTITSNKDRSVDLTINVSASGIFGGS